MQLAPNLASAAAQEARAELGEAVFGSVEPIPRTALADSLDARLTAATLAAYRRANSANLLAMAALLDGVEAPPATGTAASADHPAEPILPMADLRALPPRRRPEIRALPEPPPSDDDRFANPS